MDQLCMDGKADFELLLELSDVVLECSQVFVVRVCSL